MRKSGCGRGKRMRWGDGEGGEGVSWSTGEGEVWKDYQKKTNIEHRTSNPPGGL
jgi:hypothetical protein